MGDLVSPYNHTKRFPFDFSVIFLLQIGSKPQQPIPVIGVEFEGNIVSQALIW